MTEIKHTPTPWFFLKNGPDYAISATKSRIARFSDIFATQPHSEAQYEEAEANAEFIVRACNAHDDLVAALELSKSFIRYNTTPENCVSIGDNIFSGTDIYNSIQSALVKAKAVQS
jgi:hypothetical protein